ncbi:hypothetical protein JB92DRAFT_2926606 [Gautieria morchelliformis]|nr:hypothetical protein JB92DRAFT_2926606 [Gautieria morchelliformis]
MWCDNCLLLLPLRSGAMAWAFIILLYSLAGGIFLLEYGQYFYFVYPEWTIYGIIALAVAFNALINLVALSNKSYLWGRVCRATWPVLLVLCGVRAVIMIWELNRGQDKIAWECQNGQLWADSAAAGYGNTTAFPSGICPPGFHALYTAFIVGLLADLGFQIYMLFLNWRFTTLLEKYDSLSSSYGGLYTA